MKLDIVASSGNDEFYTPRYAILPIIPYLKNRGYTNIWCPFDTEESLFVSVLQEHEFNVTYSHLAIGQDFFTQDSVDCDCIVSNPPYSKKGEVLENLFNRNIPFAMLVGVVGLFESKKRFDMFKDNNFEILYFNKRISYFKSYSDSKPSLNPPFSSVYITKDVLDHRIEFCNIIKG